MKLQAIRGMNDILPNEVNLWQWLERQLRELANNYGYHEIRTPVLEKTELFKRTIGEVTDIVEKEMYTFDDRNGDSLSLRPEGTASVVRSGIEHGLFYNQIQKLWYLAPMYRHERPQRGRYRQFYQFSLEAFGLAGPATDVEMILFGARLWQLLGLQQHIKLELNSLGTPEVRAIYRERLVSYFKDNQALLDEESLRRLTLNPLRILDSKNPQMQDLIAKAPRLIDDLDASSREHFQLLCQSLTELGIHYTVNPRLVRGLDYYTKTVFEWVTDGLGAQGTVCAGGRYDSLVEQLGGKATPAVGFSIGIERIIALLKDHAVVDGIQQHADIYLITVGEQLITSGIKLAEALRRQFIHLQVAYLGDNGSIKSQFKKAGASGASIALIVAEQEASDHTITIKSLQLGSVRLALKEYISTRNQILFRPQQDDEVVQLTVAQDDLFDVLTAILTD